MWDREKLANLKQPIRVGVIGVGAMGKGLLHQLHRTPGMRCVAVADLNVQKAVDSAESLGYDAAPVECVDDAIDAAAAGCLPVSGDGVVVAENPHVDVLIEASTSIVSATAFVLTALRRGVPVVLMNSEVDLAFGPLFQMEAAKHGVGCTSIDGDQYTVLSRMIRDVELWGFDLVMAGNIKGFLRRRATPQDMYEEARKRNLDPVTCAAMTDGTKLNIEMALVANAHDLYTDTPGMHGPTAANVLQVPDLFDLDAMWTRRLDDGMAVTRGTVDYILGAEPGGGVFVVAHEEGTYQREMLKYYKCGDGPYYLFVRPWHICHIEAMRAVAELVVDGDPVMTPRYGYRTEVWAHAKRDLHCGETLDEIGGETCYGMIHNCGDRWTHEGLPVGIMRGAILKRGVLQGELVGVQDIEVAGAAEAFNYYRLARGCVTCPV